MFIFAKYFQWQALCWGLGLVAFSECVKDHRPQCSDMWGTEPVQGCRWGSCKSVNDGVAPVGFA